MCVHMTVGQLIEKLQRHSPDAEVCVRVTKCLCAATGETVTSVYNGFDWEMGKVMICTETPLIRQKETCKHCGTYGVSAAKDITSRVQWVDMETGDMEVVVYLGKKKKFSVPFNVRTEMEDGKKDEIT